MHISSRQVQIVSIYVKEFQQCVFHVRSFTFVLFKLLRALDRYFNANTAEQQQHLTLIDASKLPKMTRSMI